MASLPISNLPGTIRAQYDSRPFDVNGWHMAREIPKQYQRNTDDIQFLKYPSTKNSLWDHAAHGQTQTLHFSYFRKPKLDITEKVLRFAQRQIESNGQKSCACVLVGSLKIDEDGEGILFSIERLDPVGDTNISALSAAGDILIPFTLQNGFKDRGSTLEDYSNALQLLQQRCCARDPVDLGNFVLTKGWGSFYASGEQSDHHLDFEVITLGTEIVASPICPVPIVPTAWSKNLSGPMSLKHMQGIPKTGYLTMDHTQKLLLVLDSDPKVPNLPLVGIWVSGVSYVYSPYVWACCLRYLHNSTIKDRVCSPPDPFLLVLYSPTLSKPEFYDCCTASGTSNIAFDIYSGNETVPISKVPAGTNDTIEIELSILNEGTKYELFETAVHKNTGLCEADRQDSVSPDPINNDDITPRLKPIPCQSVQPTVESMVPEVSVFFGDDTAFVPIVQRPKKQRSDMKQVSVPILRHSVTLGALNANSSVAQPLANTIQCHPMTSVSANNYVNSVSNIRTAMASDPRVSNSILASYSQGNGNQHTENQIVLSEKARQQYSESSGCSPVPVQQESMKAVPTSNGVIYPTTSIPAIQGQPRPRYCSCPRCPKPSEFYSRPQSYVQMQGPLASARLNYPNYGPSPPRLPGPYPSSHTIGDNPAKEPAPVSSAYQQGIEYSHPSQQSFSVSPSANAAHMNGLNSCTIQTYPRAPGLISYQVRSVTSTRNDVPTGSNIVHSSSNQQMQQMTNTRLPQPPILVQEKLPLPKTSTNGVDRNYAYGGSDARRSNPNLDNSGHSSSDSGLSFTPEKPNSPALAGQCGTQTVTSHSVDLKSLLVSTNWENVPLQIYQLLLNQEQQLKQLQAEIAVLTAKQSMSLNTSTDKSKNINITGIDSSAKMIGTVPEMCTTINNSSMGLLAKKKDMVSTGIQTSLQKWHESFQNVLNQSSCNSHLAAKQVTSNSQSSSHGIGCNTRKSVENMPRGRLPTNGAQCEDMELDFSQGELVALVKNMHHNTIDNARLQMIVDRPSYVLSPRSTQSQELCSGPVTFNFLPNCSESASMCLQGCSDNESKYTIDNTHENKSNTAAAADDPKYFNRQLKNGATLIGDKQNSKEVHSEKDGYNADPATPVKLAKENVYSGENLQLPLCSEKMNAQSSADPSFIQNVSYMSMLSGTDLSMEMNTLAMKYFKDELLAKNQLLGGLNCATVNAAMLDRMLNEEEADDSTLNAAALGVFSNMSFATKRYLQRHGILDSTAVSAIDFTQSDSYLLNTNYSTVNFQSNEGPAEVTHEVLGTTTTHKFFPVSPTNVRESTSNYSYEHTAAGEYDRTPYNDSKQRALQDMSKVSPIPNGPDTLGQFLPNSQNNTIPQSQKLTPYSQNVLPLPHNSSCRDNIGADTGCSSTQITPAQNFPYCSPPDVQQSDPQCFPQSLRQENKGFVRSPYLKSNQMQFTQKQNCADGEGSDVPSYCSNSQQNHEQTNVGERILDLSHLWKLSRKCEYRWK